MSLSRSMALIGATLVLGATTAQQPQDELVARKQKKLASEFFTNGEWFTDYDEARAAAKSSGKLVFGYFTRSYQP